MARFVLVFPDFCKRCVKCREWKPDTAFNGKFQDYCKDKKQPYCKKCANENHKASYRRDIFRNRRENKRRSMKYLTHQKPEVAERNRVRSNYFRILQRLRQRKARGELVIDLVCQIWDITREDLQGRINMTSTEPEIIQARVTVTSLFRRLTHFHPDAIADKFDICTHDIAIHGKLFRKFTDLRDGDIIVLSKINRVRKLYKENRVKTNIQSRLPYYSLPGYDTYTEAERTIWNGPIVKRNYPKGTIDLESLTRGVCWFMGTDYSDLFSDRRGLQGSARTRQVLTYILRKYEGWTYQEIGEYLNRDHASCHHNYALGAEVLGKDEDSLIYELNRVWSSRKRYVLLVAYLFALIYRYEDTDMQVMRA